MLAVRVHEFGDSSSLVPEEVPEPVAGPDEVLIDVHAAGVNFGDILVRRGEYFGRKALPVIPGWEVIGIAEAGSADGVIRAGERVVALLEGNGYAQKVAAPVKDTVPVPDDIPDHVALAMVIQGATAWHLLETLVAGESVLISGAGSGVTHLLIQLARRRGAKRIVVTGSGETKASLARSLGADKVVRTDSDVPLADQLSEEFGDEKVDLVIDMVGGEVLEGMLRCLRPGGRAVIYGIASGTPTRISTGALLRNGWNVSGLWLGHGTAEPLSQTLGRLFDLYRAGELSPTLGPELPLSRAGDAHLAVEARTGVGKIKLDCRPVP